MGKKGKGKGKVEPRPLSKAELEEAMSQITSYNKQISLLTESLKTYCQELKEKGVNVPVLKKVCAIQESEEHDAFAEYWKLYEDGDKEEAIESESRSLFNQLKNRERRDLIRDSIRDHGYVDEDDEYDSDELIDVKMNCNYIHGITC